MIEVTVACEDQAEEAFFGKVLYRSLLERSVLVRPRLIATSLGHVGWLSDSPAGAAVSPGDVA